MQKRNVLNSPRLLELKKKRQKVFFSKVVLSVIAFTAIVGGLIYISRLPSLNIKEITIVGNKVADTEMLQARVQKEITGNYVWFFPKTNIFFYPKNKIEKALHAEFKRLKEINISVKSPGILEISTSEREGKYIWCEKVAIEESAPKENCYFMDDAGFIFDKAPYISGEVYFKFYGAASVGTYFAKENFKQLIDFKDTLTTMELKPISLEIQNDGDVKVFLSSFNKGGVGPYIIFKADADFQKVIENLEAALNTEPLMSNFKNKYPFLIYIDLRLGSKVYYKFQ